MSMHNLTVSAIGQSLALHVLTTGQSGKSAYQIAVDNGFAGSQAQWLASLQGAGAALVSAFSWGDATPAVIASVPAGKVAFKVEVVLLTAFDTASILTVGDSGDHARLIGQTDIDVMAAGIYQTNPAYLYAAATDIALYLTVASGNTQGNGIVLIYLQD